MEKSKVIILDRDGTINYDYGYVHDIDKLVFIEGALDALKLLYDNGYKLVIITNQSGIGRGYFTIEDYNKFNRYFLKKIEEQNIKIEKVYTCPHIDEDNCDCRKPKLGLFYKAIAEMNIDLDNSYAIGDKIRDIAISNETNIKGIIVGSKIEEYECYENLLQAALNIIK